MWKVDEYKSITIVNQKLQKTHLHFIKLRASLLKPIADLGERFLFTRDKLFLSHHLGFTCCQFLFASCVLGLEFAFKPVIEMADRRYDELDLQIKTLYL